MEEDNLSSLSSLSCGLSSVSSLCRLLAPGVTLTWISSVELESVSVSRLRFVTPADLASDPRGFPSSWKHKYWSGL